MWIWIIGRDGEVNFLSLGVVVDGPFDQSLEAKPRIEFRDTGVAAV